MKNQSPVLVWLRPMALLLSVGLTIPHLQAQVSNASDNNSPAITLTPAIMMVKAKPGQTFSQDLTLWNNTIHEMEFQMAAEDIVIRDGKRIFVPAGEVEGSIARYAVFSSNDLIAMPGSSVTTRVTVTVPTAPGPRAIACIFMGKTRLNVGISLAMTASLGSLVTFSLGDDFRMQSDPMQVSINADSKVITFRQRLKNAGTEPLVPKGVIAVTNERGVIVTRLPVSGQRLLPGESLDFTAEHLGLPKTGTYKAMLLLEHESSLFSDAAEFAIQ